MEASAEERLWRLRVAPSGPLASYLDLFASALLEQGYKRHLISRQIRTVAYFSAWLNAEDIEIENITDSHTHQFLDARYSTEIDQARSKDQGARSTIRRLLVWCREQGLTEPEKAVAQNQPILCGDNYPGRSATTILTG